MRKLLEDLVQKVDDKARKEIDAHLKEGSRESRRDMVEHKFGKLGMGTKKYFRDAYHTVTEYSKKEKLVGATEDDDLVKVIEKLALTALPKLGTKEANDAAFYAKKAADKKNGFKTAKERLQELKKMFYEHLGIQGEEFDELYRKLGSGDEDNFYKALEDLTDMASQSIINAYLQKKVATGRAMTEFGSKAFNAYLIKQVEKDSAYKFKESKLGEKIEGYYGNTMGVYHAAKEGLKKKEMKKLDLEEKPKKDGYSGK